MNANGAEPCANTLSPLTPNWYVFFYPRQKMTTGVETLRIGANCLSDAITVARELADRCNLNVIGVAEDLGVQLPESSYPKEVLNVEARRFESRR